MNNNNLINALDYTKYIIKILLLVFKISYCFTNLEAFFIQKILIYL